MKMFPVLRVSSLSVLLVSSLGFSVPSSSIMQKLKNKQSANTSYLAKSLCKRSADNAVWKMVGSKKYDRADDNWTLSSRDTVIFNAAGNEIINRISKAQNRWNIDSLESVDSSVYSGNKVIEYYYTSYYQGKINYTNRTNTSYQSSENLNIYVGIRNKFDTLTHNWVLAQKDSIIYSGSFKNFYEINDYNCIRKYAFDYDPDTKTMKLDSSFIKSDGECNDTTLVYLSMFTEGDEIYEKKYIYKYKGTGFKNLIEKIEQQKDPSSGTYSDNMKSIYSLDSHGNDTLRIISSYNTNSSSWDTTGYRYLRSYDANGNNFETIESYYSSFNKMWTLNKKEENTFAKISIAGILSQHAKHLQNVSMIATANSIQFSAPSITELNLYNISGRLVASVKQQSGPSISLNLTAPHSRIASGTYLAELVCGNSKKPFPLVISK